MRGVFYPPYVTLVLFKDSRNTWKIQYDVYEVSIIREIRN